jgi:integrase
MVKLNYLADMRPGEVCVMRACDIDMAGEIWIYTPHTHKMEHKDLSRRIAMGPLAQEVIRPSLTTNPAAYLFSPTLSEAERMETLAKARAELRKAKKLFPSWVERYARMAEARGRNTYADHYTEAAYRKAIHYACKMASIDPWNPNQLRHTRATEIRRLFGLEAAADALGHMDLSTSEIYAEKSLERAIEIARKIG